jgi:hypothetical protein
MCFVGQPGILGRRRHRGNQAVDSREEYEPLCVCVCEQTQVSGVTCGCVLTERGSEGSAFDPTPAVSPRAQVATAYISLSHSPSHSPLFAIGPQQRALGSLLPKCHHSSPPSPISFQLRQGLASSSSQRPSMNPSRLPRTNHSQSHALFK